MLNKANEMQTERNQGIIQEELEAQKLSYKSKSNTKATNRGSSNNNNDFHFIIFCKRDEIVARSIFNIHGVIFRANRKLSADDEHCAHWDQQWQQDERFAWIAISDF